MTVTAVFDIGKTNKKFFLFDEDFREVFKEQRAFDELADDDGDPSDNLPAIRDWMQKVFARVRKNKKFKIRALNFSTYGASFVHLDARGNVLTPLYNYLKPMPEEVLQSFYDKYGDPLIIAGETASPALGMLNSGLQLYWLKYAKPEVFRQIRYSLHFPQYLSYLFTGVPVSDFTSTGCHTALWDYEKGDYHEWVYAEGVDRILPPIVPTSTSINITYAGTPLTVGVGIHDSSAALLPYLRAGGKPFLLLSTGTWSIALNPFSEESLSGDDLRNDCLNYMRPDGKPVKASRLFLGHEHLWQADKLETHYQKETGCHREVAFDAQLFYELSRDYRRTFHFDHIKLARDQPESTSLESLATFEAAYHQLIMELMEMQVHSAARAIGQTDIRRIYLDGGFADNDVFVNLLLNRFKDYKIRITRSAIGAALGAALVIADKKAGQKVLKKYYAVTKAVWRGDT